MTAEDVPGFANPVHVYEDYEDHHWWYIARRRIVVPLVKAFLAPGSQVVDVGCGAGANLAALVGTYRCVGIDISEKLVSAGRRRFPGIEFIQGNAPEALGTHASTADAFLLMDVLEHIEDDRGYFERLFWAARPGAIFVITVPADPRLWSRHDVAVGHHRRYTPESLSTLWRGLPADQPLLTPFNRNFYPLIRLARANDWIRARLADCNETDFNMPPPFLNTMMASVMGSERRRILRALAAGKVAPFRRGVSLLAVVRKRP
jgi:SAM-dependent methyltransferase